MNKTLNLRLSDFDYVLPKELIAQDALPERAKARLLVLNRESGSIEHKTFRDIAEYFEKGDVLVLNDTKVIPARLFGKRATGGKVEILLLKPVPLPKVPGSATQLVENEGSQTGILRPFGTQNDNIWRALIKPSGRVRQGEVIELDGGVTIKVIDAPVPNAGIRHLEFNCDVAQLMETQGRIPLPPYIGREDAPVDREFYQTVFASRPGAVASPTAGLHFDQALLNHIEAKGVKILFVTLHVSYGTFQPVASEDLSQHKMHEEYFDIPDEVAEQINFAKTNGKRIIACGTTVVRTLESAAENMSVPGTAGTGFGSDANKNLFRNVPGTVVSKQGLTDLFIYPPHEFKIADAMITNFHLPRTTLLMLTSAFAGHDNLMRAYQEAIEKRYRFYSYGDAMLIV